MARKFDGSGDYLTGVPGALSGMDGGPITIASILILDGTSPGGAIVYCGGGDVSGVSLDVFEGSYYLASQEPALATASTSDGWHLVAANKAAGTQTPRFHKYVYSTDAWTHADAGGTMGDGTTVAGGDTLQIGRWGTGSGRFNGSIAVVGVWDRVLADAEIELLAFSLQAWYASAPKAAWLLDQATATTSIVDLTGGGANVTGGTGTSVSTSSVPVFSYSFDALIPHSVPAAAGDANPTPAAITATTSVGAPALSTGSTATPATINAATSIGGTSVSTGATATPSTVTATVSVADATVSTGSTVSPSAVAATATILAPTLSVGSTVSPDSVAAAAAVAVPALSTSSTTAPAAISITLTLPQATISVGGDAAVNPDVLAAVTSIGAPSLSTGATVSPSAIAATTTLPAATVAGQDIATTFRVGRPHGRWHVGPPHGRWRVGRPKGQ